MFDLHEALAYVVEQGASDLHLKVPSRPVIRVNGTLQPLDQYEPIMPEDTSRILHIMLNEKQIAAFEEENEIDFAYAVSGLARFRVNAFKQRGSISIALRTIPYAVRTVSELGLPPAIGNFDIQVDGTRVGHFEANTTASGFYDATYPVPSALTRGKNKLTVRFQATGGRIAPVFAVRTVRVARA